MIYYQRSYLLGHCKSTITFELTVLLPLDSPWRWEVPGVELRSIARRYSKSLRSIVRFDFCLTFVDKARQKQRARTDKSIIVLTERVEKRILL